MNNGTVVLSSAQRVWEELNKHPWQRSQQWGAPRSDFILQDEPAPATTNGAGNHKPPPPPPPAPPEPEPEPEPLPDAVRRALASLDKALARGGRRDQALSRAAYACLNVDRKHLEDFRRYAIAKDVPADEVGAAIGKALELKQGIAAANPPAPGELKPDASGAILRLADWLTRKLPKPDKVLGHWLTTTSRVMIYAPTGLGKTMLALSLAMRIAAGLPFLRWIGHKPRLVLYIDGEMARELLQERLADEVRRAGCQPEGFHAVSHEDIENFAPLNTPEGQKAIDDIIAKIGGVDLIIFDNIMALIGGDHKDEEGWARALPWIKSLTKRKIGQIWIHHTGHDNTHSYGTKTREWQMDTVIRAEEVKRHDTDVSFSLKFEKARGRRPEYRSDFADITVALTAAGWEHADTPPEPKKVAELTDRDKIAKKALANLLCDIGEPHHAAPPGAKAVRIKDWRAQAYKEGLASEDDPEVRKKAFTRAREKLVTRGIVGTFDEFAWLVK